MTALDWIIIAFVALMALWGYAQGLLASALSLAGFAVGAVAGSRLAPLLLPDGSRSPYGPLVALTGGLLVGAVFALLGERLGAAARGRIAIRSGRLLDDVAGALLFAALGLGLVWIGGAAVLQTPGIRDLRRDVQQSAILSRLNDELPPTGPLLNSIARFDPFPQIEGPEAGVRRPNARILSDPDVQAAQVSVVRILGSACGLAIEGSGWVARPGVVVTNAHVVAGESDTTVQAEGGEQLDAQAIAFNEHDDIAVLRVPGLQAPPLAQRPTASSGTPVAILGYPENGPYLATPGRLGTTGTVISVDAYGSGPTRRQMTAFRGRVRSGNSGGPVIDRRGRVVATVFAAATRGPRRGFGVPAEVVARVLGSIRGPVGTGPCAR